MSCLLAGLLATCLAMPVLAQSEQDANDEEEKEEEAQRDSSSVTDTVIVTAQKREQSVQDVSLAVTALTGDALQKLGYEAGLEVYQQVPNMNFFAIFGEASSPSISMRGISLVNFSDSWESPVSIYVDEVYRGNPAGSAIQLFDLERVEVLRGPQGTLFGRNATGGLVQYVTAGPTEEFEAHGSVQVGSYSQRIFEGAVSGGIADGVRGRFAFKVNQDDGWQVNNGDSVNDYGVAVNTSKKLNETNTYGFRGKLEFDIGDASELLLDVHGSSADQQSVGFAHMGYLDFNPDGTVSDQRCSVARIHRGECTSNTFATTGIIQSGGDFNPEDVSSSIGGADGIKTEIDTFGAYARYIADFESFTLTSVTAYESLEKLLEDDGDGVSAGPNLDPEGNTFDVFFDEQYTVDAEQITQELRLNGNTNRMKWVAGLYLYDDLREMTTQNPGDEEFDAAADIGFAHFEDVSLDTQSWAVFGQTEYDLSNQLTLVTGLRYTDEERDFDYIRDPSYYGSNYAVQDSLSEDALTGRLGLDYRPDDSTLIYGSLSTGHRSGGYSASYNNKPEAFEPVTKEEITNFELGWKKTFADNRARFNAAAFVYELEGFQTQLFENVSTGQVILNAGDVTGKGIEAELNYRVTDYFEVIGGLGLLDTELDSDRTSIVAGDVLSLDGNELPSAPAISYNLLARYYRPLKGGSEMAFQLDYSWQDEHFLQVENDPFSRHPSYGIGNAKVTWRSADRQWAVSGMVKNITDEEYFTYQNTLGDDWGYGVWGKPRTWSVQVRWTY
ncbi:MULTISPECIES: TonB-dependent receptor [unclassified Wenzhouxiangella]|uniref:TonB-dependent receptor n=1 Tax=unclassified Wenzhouxiangella TaxID=2613841 RepID=UPI0015F27C7A|nr:MULTISPECIES: TonB-dependent receptor [unclassified Wenzhouxiangella]